MGVDITTDSAVAAALVYSAGFTNGDPQAGKSPTAFDSGWANSLTLEVNYSIQLGGLTPTYTDDISSWTQLGSSIFEQDSNYYPRIGGVVMTTYRSHDSGGGSPDGWKKWERTDYYAGAAQATTQTICPIYDIPNDSQFWVTFEGEVVQTDSITTYSNIVLRCSCRKVGGTVTIQKTTIVDSDGALGVTWSVVNSLGGPALRAQLPAAPGKTFNFSAYGRAHNVKRT